MKKSFRFWDMIFPPRCAFCRSVLKTGEHDICGKCIDKLPYSRGADAKQGGEFYDICVSSLFYEGSVRDSLLRYKFKDATGYAGCYGRLLAEAVKEYLAGKYEIITWVPLSEKREKTRGYDQAMLLAMALAVELGDVAAETLKKIEDTPAQSNITDREKRQANVLGVYEVADVEIIEGKRILLVDDIVTTGATLSECARMLRMSGAESVVCAAVARGR